MIAAAMLRRRGQTQAAPDTVRGRIVLFRPRRSACSRFGASLRLRRCARRPTLGLGPPARPRGSLRAGLQPAGPASAAAARTPFPSAPQGAPLAGLVSGAPKPRRDRGA